MNSETDLVILFIGRRLFLLYNKPFWFVLTGDTGTSLTKRGTVNVATDNCRGRVPSPDELLDDWGPLGIGVALD